MKESHGNANCYRPEILEEVLTRMRLEAWITTQLRANEKPGHCS